MLKRWMPETVMFVFSCLNKVKPAKVLGEFFLETKKLTIEYAFRNNLTCKLKKEAKAFLEMEEDRRIINPRKATASKIKTQQWEFNEENYVKSDTNVALGIDFSQQGKLCIRRDNTVYDNYFVGASDCKDTYKIIGGWRFKGANEPVFPGIYFICGNKAYYRMPAYGICYVGLVFPKIIHVDRGTNGIREIGKPLTCRRRESFIEIIGDIFGALILAVGISFNANKIRKLSTIVDCLSTSTAGGFLMVNTEMVAMRAMVMQNRIDILLAKEGGVCGILKVQHCCTYIPDKSQNIQRFIKNNTELHKEITPLEVDGVLKKLGKSFSAVKKWFVELGISLVGKVLIPITIVIMIALILRLGSICIGKRKAEKQIKLNIEKNNQREREMGEIELEELKEKMYKN
ncbi:uncharacterized protein LOC144761137 [Lissotriton helveticus]